MDELTRFRLFLIQEQNGKKRLRSPRSAEIHIRILARLQRIVPDLSPEKIMLHLMALYDEGRKGTYLNDHISTLRIYGRFKGIPIFDSLKYFPEEQFEKAIMSDAEIEAFLALPPTLSTRTSKTGKVTTYTMGAKRWEMKTLFWKIMAYTGMRPGEIAKLSVETVDFGRGLFLADGKTGKRLVPIPKHLTTELTMYISALTTQELFPAIRKDKKTSTVINDAAWGEDFHNRINRLGIKRKNLTPYSLRHSLITRLLNEDVNLYKVQNLVGHVQGSPTTATYYHLTTKGLFKTISQDPLGRHQMTYDERFSHFRDNVKDLLKNFAKSPTEEMQMVRDLTKTFFLLLFSIPCLIRF